MLRFAMTPLAVTFICFAAVACQQEPDDDTFRALYPLTLTEILADTVACPSISSDYLTDYGAIGEDGYFHGDIFIDARVDLSTCDDASLVIATRGKLSVLQWWVNRCEGDYESIGDTHVFERPGDIRREITLTKTLVDKGCGGLDEARQRISEN